jgi:hypothetical protein
LDTGYLIFHRLRAVDARAYVDRCGDAGYSHRVHYLVATLDRRKDHIPFTLDIGSVSVQLRLKASLAQHPFAGSHISDTETPTPSGTTQRSAMTFMIFSILNRLTMGDQVISESTEAGFRFRIDLPILSPILTMLLPESAHSRFNKI